MNAFFSAWLLWAAQAQVEPSPFVKDVAVIENVGEAVPLDAPFTNHRGQPVTLREVLSGGRPVVLTPVYYSCPTLCPMVLSGVAGALKGTGLKLGADYALVTFSIAPEETFEQAAEKRLTVAHVLGAPADGSAWPFWVGDARSVHALTDALGFKYRYDAQLKQYAHQAVFMVLTPEGKISRYLYGAQFRPRQLRLALVEASQGKVGTTFDQLMLTCYRYEPATRRYQFYVQGILRAGGLAVFAALVALLTVLWRRESTRGSPFEGARR
ncbi:MAG: SCO family protein [Myxococcaceae bacterium]|nr:SCO family protein [Myxococcaceae bacterium]